MKAKTMRRIGMWLAIGIVQLFGTVAHAEMAGQEIFPSGQGDPPTNSDQNSPNIIRTIDGVRVVHDLQCIGKNMRHSYSTLSINNFLRVAYTIAGQPPIQWEIHAREAFLNEAAQPGPRFTVAPYIGTDLPSGGNPPINPITRVFIGTFTSRVTIDFTRFTVGSTVLSGSEFTVNDNPVRFTAGPTLTQTPVGGTTSLYNYNDRPLSINGPFGQEVHIRITVVGELGFCGSYRSPLMLFFDDKRPNFTNKSYFPVDYTGGEVFWVEEGAPGYFLALDRNGDGLITEADELFGSARHKNGFEALRELDTNGDNRIDAADARFAQLRLWRDRNGDGHSDADEMVSLSEKGVTEISLDYRSDRRWDWGARASAREYASFRYRHAEGNMRSGQVIDVWLNPTGKYHTAYATPEGFLPKAVIGGPSIFDSLF